jgi:peroxiredoxin
VTIVVLGVLVAVLSLQNRELKKGAQPREQAKVGEALDLGSLVSVINQDVSSQQIRAMRILFVMATTCDFCKASLSNWEKVAAEAKQLGVEVLAVSLDSLGVARRYAESNSISFSVFVPSEREEFRRRNKFYGVPKTIILDERNVIVELWSGRVSDEVREQITIRLHQLMEGSKS